jgi:hypothetical protein
MRGDPLAFEENLDRPGGHPDVHLGAGEAIGNAVIGVCLTFRAESASGEGAFWLAAARRLSDRTSRA